MRERARRLLRALAKRSASWTEGIMRTFHPVAFGWNIRHLCLTYRISTLIRDLTVLLENTLGQCRLCRTMMWWVPLQTKPRPEAITEMTPWTLTISSTWSEAMARNTEETNFSRLKMSSSCSGETTLKILLTQGPTTTWQCTTVSMVTLPSIRLALHRTKDVVRFGTPSSSPKWNMSCLQK